MCQLFAGFQLDPKHLFINSSDLSPNTRQTAKACGVDLDNLSAERRLCLTLRDKKKYTVHYRNLQFYPRHGLVVTKIYSFAIYSSTVSQTVYGILRRKTTELDFFSSLYKNISNMVADT